MQRIPVFVENIIFQNHMISHGNIYYIGKVSTMDEFLTGLTPPESIFVDFEYIIPVFSTTYEKQELSIIFQNHLISQ